MILQNLIPLNSNLDLFFILNKSVGNRNEENLYTYQKSHIINQAQSNENLYRKKYREKSKDIISKYNGKFPSLKKRNVQEIMKKYKNSSDSQEEIKNQLYGVQKQKVYKNSSPIMNTNTDHYKYDQKRPILEDNNIYSKNNYNFQRVISRKNSGNLQIYPSHLKSTPNLNSSIKSKPSKFIDRPYSKPGVKIYTPYQHVKQESHVSTYNKKRNFSPLPNNKIYIQNKEQLFKNQQVETHASKQEENDSLGGGSQINSKTGSVLNFGGGSRVADNMSVLSRYY